MDLNKLGRAYRRFLRCMAVLAKFPITLGYLGAPWLAYIGLSPIKQEAAGFRQALEDAGKRFSDADWLSIWRKRLADQAIFCLHIFKQPKCDAKWVKQQITVDLAQLETLLQAQGSVLFLTYHHAYQHTLCAALGAAGLPLNALAAPEESSPLFAFIGTYIKQLHRGCALHFNGGKYLFFDRDMAGARMAKRALANGGILISLNDFSGSQEKCPAVPVFNRRITAPTGSVKLACRLGIPIVAGGMLRDGQHYQIVMRQIDNTQNITCIMRDYFAFLEEISADAPHFWDGWNWFSGLPHDSVETLNDSSS